MFGFLRVNKCSLSDEESERYRAHFCATCHAMDGFGGKLSSLLTNYDVTFWLLVLSALEGSDEIGYGRCTAVPWRTVPLARLSPRGLRAVAALNLALVGSKVEDDRVDGDRKLVGLAFRLLDKPLGKAREVLISLDFPLDSLAELHRRQAAAERCESPTLDSLCAPTCEMLGNVFVFLARLTDRPELAEPLRSCGAALGRVLYLLDALKDYRDDRRRNRFNAFLRTGSSVRVMRDELSAALNDFQGRLGVLPLESRSELIAGLLEGLRKQIREGLSAVGLRSRSRSRSGSLRGSRMGSSDGALLASFPTSFPAAVPASFPGRRFLARAGFIKPPSVQDGCDCGGCDGCDCSGCDGCGGCGGCDGCGGCNCDGCTGCQCDSCGTPDCGGCRDVDCSGCDFNGCDCCCECCDCDGFDICCFWNQGRAQRRYTRLEKKKARRNGEPPPAPVDGEGDADDAVKAAMREPHDRDPS